MKRWATVLLALAFGLSAYGVFAEGRCPDGYFPIGGGNAGWEGCAPMGGDGEGGDEGPAPVWETRWGSIAITDGAFGVSESSVSKSEAERIALQDCQRRSNGQKCRTKITYRDQCAALVWGSVGANASRGPYVEEVIKSAISVCSQQDKDCTVFYSGCSMPERVQ
jgi:Domain of unknown function (DUF4189)